VYAGLRERGIKSAAAQQLIKKVVDAYTTLRVNVKAGNLGKESSKRRRKVESKPIVFRVDAAQPYDCRNMGRDIDAQTVAITTRRGRLKGIRFVCSAEQLKTLALYRKGEADLLCRDGAWYLYATCEVPEAETYEPHRFIGVLKTSRASATGSAPQAPTGHLPLLGLCPARRLHRLQGTPRRCAAGVRRSSVHIPDVLRMPAHRQAESRGPGTVHLPGLRRRCGCGPECFPQHRPARRGRVEGGA
jgi:hypothetical protein